MKFILTLLAAVLFFMFLPTSHADEDASLDFFYDRLDAYGTWQDVGDYGYCWQPEEVDDDWRPYSDGRWVYTDAGWTWDSDEAFGWAVYHCGRWANVRHFGWIWIPGTEWGPGWVSWRNSTDYVGWAPLPPEAHFQHDTGFRPWVDDYYDIGPSNYCFIESRNFGNRHLRSVFIDRRQNINLMVQTINITNISYTNKMVHNGGPSYDQLAQHSEHAIGRYKLDRRQIFEGNHATMRPEHLKSRIEGDSMSMFAMPFQEHYKSEPRKMHKRIEAAEVEHGWRNAGSAQEVEEARNALKNKERNAHEQRPDDLPRQPKFAKPRAIPVEHEEPDKQSKGNQPRSDSRPNPSDKDKEKKDDKPPVTEEKKVPRTERPPTREDDQKPSKEKHPEAPKPRPKADRKDPNPETEPKTEPRKEPKDKRDAEPKKESKRAEPKPEPAPKHPESEAPKRGNDEDKEKGHGKKGKDLSQTKSGAPIVL